MEQSKASIQSSELLLGIENDVAAHITAQLARIGIGTETQRVKIGLSVGQALADYFSMTWGGHPIYIPKDAKRRAAIMYAEFTGNNHAELARKFGLCVQSVYRIIKQEQEARRLNQGNLLDYTNSRSEE